MTHTPGPWTLDPDDMGVVLGADRVPIQKRPTEWDRGIALLKLSLSVNAVRTIYAEGMLFLPPEVSAELARRRATGELKP